MEKKEERLKVLAELFDQIPEEDQKGIVIGTQMLATFYNPKKVQTA